MHITFVKKIKTDGTECRKCIEVQSRLEKDGYIEKINAIKIYLILSPCVSGGSGGS